MCIRDRFHYCALQCNVVQFCDFLRFGVFFGVFWRFFDFFVWFGLISSYLDPWTQKTSLESKMGWFDFVPLHVRISRHFNICQTKPKTKSVVHTTQKLDNKITQPIIDSVEKVGDRKEEYSSYHLLQRNALSQRNLIGNK